MSRTALMRGIVAPFFGLLAVACIILGLCNAYLWKPSSEVTAQTKISNAQYATTDPGVLQLVGKGSQLTVDASNVNICVALGSSKDVAGWVSGHTYTRITGLTDWTTLSTEQSQAQSSASNANGGNQVAFKDSDMWTTVKCAVGTVTLDASAAGGDTVALVDLGESNVFSVNMHWVRDRLPDFATPFYFAGGLFAVLTVLCASVFARPAAKRRKREVESTSSPASEEVPLGQAVAGSLAGVTQGLAGIGSMMQGRPRRSHRRHAASTEGEAPVEVSKTTEVPAGSDAGPLIIEPSAHNMVSQQQEHQGKHHTAHLQLPGVKATDNAETSVISRRELDDYFARLAAESAASAREAPQQPPSNSDNRQQHEEGEQV